MVARVMTLRAVVGRARTVGMARRSPRLPAILRAEGGRAVESARVRSGDLNPERGRHERNGKSARRRAGRPARRARGARRESTRETPVPESGHGHRGGWDVRRVRLARAAVTRARSLRRATWPFLGSVGAIPALRFFRPRRRGAAEARMVWWALAASRTSTRAGSMANPKTTLYVGTSSPSKLPSFAPFRPSSCATRSLRERRLTRRVDPLPISVLSRRRT